MKKNKLFLILLASFLLCLIFTSSLMASGMTLDDDDDDDGEEDVDEDGVDDDLEESNERDVNIEISDEKAEIESELKFGESKDEFELEVSIDDEGIEVELEYDSEIETGATEVEFELEFKINFYALLEFVDTNTDGVYNESDDDELIQMVELTDFEKLNYTVDTIENTDRHIITVVTTDGVFTCKIYAVGEFALIDGNVVTPTEVKIDIIIQNFEYMNTESMLALYTRLESSTEYEQEDVTEDEIEGFADNEAALETVMNSFTGFFSWVENATIDGTQVPVTSSLYDEDDDDDDDDDYYEQKVYLNYPHGDLIIHDPKIGIAGILLSPSIPSEIVSKMLDILKLSKEGYLVSVAVFTLLVISGIVLYRRKKR